MPSLKYNSKPSAESDGDASGPAVFTGAGSLMGADQGFLTVDRLETHMLWLDSP
jgi:hypothetical protein